MDSMRNLSTSLPSSSRRRLDQPELLMDFKAAALSVTNLYKSAVSVQAKARAIGYQDALDDLLGFLDKEEMGLMDGEGWRVRRWATQRLDEGGVEREGEGSGDEVEPEAAKDEAPLVAADTRSSSPEAQRKAVVPREASEDSGIIVSEAPILSQQQQRQGTRSPTPIPQHTAQQQQQHTVPTAENFTFRSNHTYPSGNHDRERERGTSMELDTTSQSHMSSSTPPSSSDTTLRHYPHPRPSRNHRHTNHNRQRERERGTNENGRTTASGTISLNLSANNGKRKMPYPDFFDISGVNFDGNDNRRDGSGNGRGTGGGGGGGKRGRHV
ncbi:hypothetical protein LTR27_003242 [Elasticomyces elasticus]|nr:hypothetical protein LTR27_003242 [Elasticomyces elasticus]